MSPDALPADSLAITYEPDRLGFGSTDDLEDLDEVLGQERALSSIRFGADIRSPGFNLFLLGTEGTGRLDVVRNLLHAKAVELEVPSDWVYVHNFSVAHKPNAIRLPPGRGRALADAMQLFVEDIRASVPAFLGNEENQSRLRAIDEEIQHKPEAAFEDLRERAAERHIALLRTPMGFGFAPMTEDGEVMKPEDFAKLPKSEQERIEAEIEELQKTLQGIIERIPRWDKERRDAIHQLQSEMTAIAIGASIEQVIEQFRDLPEVTEYLAALRQDLTENFHALQLSEQMESRADPAREARVSTAEIGGFDRYKVNAFVSNGVSAGAPVIYEDNPTVSNLIGRVEHVSRLGALVTDFSLIKAGSLHRANGGFIILDAIKLLQQPFSWEALKRALKGRRVNIESPGQMLSMISTISLEPEPVPLDAKVVLIGSRRVYYLLSRLDPEFADLFKVEADFDDEIDRTESAEDLFPRMIATRLRRDGLQPFDASAVASVMRHAVRLAGDRQKLSVHMRSIADLLHEADFLARRNGADRVSEEHVREAVDKQIHRSDRLRERSYEMITRDIVLLSTDGAAVGQVNGLSVLQLGGFAFGRPTRITARVRLGAGKVIDIEREVELGGPLHSKGVMILAGFLAARYAVDQPLSVAATLVFEQSYGGVDGDSASSAELYALLSALADLPLRQDLAVTGSVNQHGEVQVIGGVNEKIEGFFEICRRRGLTGTQGVLIPAANVDHLMLRDEVVDAARRGAFHIYPVTTIDEGLTLLTGRPAGERMDGQRYAAESVNGLVEERLLAFANARRMFGRHDGDGEPADKRP